MPFPLSEPDAGDVRYTFADYRLWPKEERWELIEGIPFAMSPAPNTAHQEIAWELARQIGNFLVDHPCRGFSAPFDVRLAEPSDRSDEYASNVVQPDILVVCDPEKIDDRGCRGAPDFVVEIVSPSSASRDYILKQALYERHGVREYWLVLPEYRLVTVFLLNEEGRYGAPVHYSEAADAVVETLPGLVVDLRRVFGGMGSVAGSSHTENQEV